MTTTQPTQQVFYLISQDYYNNELMDIINKNNVLSHINEKNLKPVEIDVDEIDNLFELIEEGNNAYKIIYIHKHQRIHDKFNVGDIIYMDYGMVSFYTKTETNGKLDKIAIYPTKIAKKEDIILYDENSVKICN